MKYRILMPNDLNIYNKKSNSIEESFLILKDFLSDENTEVFLDGEENFFGKSGNFIIDKKHFVDNISNIKIEVRSNEHTPPHFHIILNEFEGSYTIENCCKLEGNISKKHEKKVKLWFNFGGKDKLIEKWNLTRPTNCQVGKIKI